MSKARTCKGCCHFLTLDRTPTGRPRAYALGKCNVAEAELHRAREFLAGLPPSVYTGGVARITSVRASTPAGLCRSFIPAVGTKSPK